MPKSKKLRNLYPEEGCSKKDPKKVNCSVCYSSKNFRAKFLKKQLKKTTKISHVIQEYIYWDDRFEMELSSKEEDLDILDHRIPGGWGASGDLLVPLPGSEQDQLEQVTRDPVRSACWGQQERGQMQSTDQPILPTQRLRADSDHSQVKPEAERTLSAVQRNSMLLISTFNYTQSFTPLPLKYGERGTIFLCSSVVSRQFSCLTSKAWRKIL